MTVLETARLNLRKMSEGDAGFILELLNDPSFLRYIGDKGVRTIEDARVYIRNGPVDSYERLGYGLWLVELKESKERIGICGLLKRDALPDADIGYAFLPRFRSMGYAFESASAVLSYGANVLGLKRILAVTNPDNAGSIRVLEKIGLKFQEMVRLTEGAPEIRLFASE